MSKLNWKKRIGSLVFAITIFVPAAASAQIGDAPLDFYYCYRQYPSFFLDYVAVGTTKDRWISVSQGFDQITARLKNGKGVSKVIYEPLSPDGFPLYRDVVDKSPFTDTWSKRSGAFQIAGVTAEIFFGNGTTAEASVPVEPYDMTAYADQLIFGLAPFCR